jgi:hypothetical protein
VRQPTCERAEEDGTMDDRSVSVVVQDVRDLAELTPDELAEQMKTGELCVVVAGALSEWGSRVETLITKLEKSVMAWHEPGRSRTLRITFEEEPAEATTSE